MRLLCLVGLHTPRSLDVKLEPDGRRVIKVGCDSCGKTRTEVQSAYGRPIWRDKWRI